MARIGRRTVYGYLHVDAVRSPVVDTLLPAERNVKQAPFHEGEARKASCSNAIHNSIVERKCQKYKGSVPQSNERVRENYTVS